MEIINHPKIKISKRIEYLLKEKYSNILYDIIGFNEIIDRDGDTGIIHYVKIILSINNDYYSYFIISEKWNEMWDDDIIYEQKLKTIKSIYFLESYFKIFYDNFSPEYKNIYDNKFKELTLI